MNHEQNHNNELNSCDAEPVQFVGGIQSHGSLMIIDAKTHQLMGWSLGIENFLQNINANSTDTQSSQSFGDNLQAQMLEWIQTPAFKNGEAIDREYIADGVALDCRIFKVSESQIAVEFEERIRAAEEVINFDQGILNGFGSELRECKSIQEVGSRACAAIRQLTGLERVMLYRFSHEDWHGEVIAEDKASHAHSFLNHKFPQHDIPLLARQLYLKNRVRFILDSESKAHAIEFSDESKPSTIDLSDSRLRAAAPIHLEYLCNMGVKSSFSVAVVVADKLWGLFACHHPSVRALALQTRLQCLQIADICSAVLPLILLDTEARELRSFTPKLFSALRNFDPGQNSIDQILQQAPHLLELFQATGLSIIDGTTIESVGAVPPRDSIAEIADFIKNQSMVKLVPSPMAIETLSKHLAGFEKFADFASGVLIMTVGRSHQVTLLIFRGEVLRNIQWGGDPTSHIATRGYVGRINPRLSFNTWIETIKNTCMPWARHEIEGLEQLARFIS